MRLIRIRIRRPEPPESTGPACGSQLIAPRSLRALVVTPKTHARFASPVSGYESGRFAFAADCATQACLFGCQRKTVHTARH
jgi:hypothetical protein